jgi:sulfur-oxidizing protein SoxX
LVRTLFHIVCALAAVLLLRAADAQTLAPYKIVADGIPESLTGSPGDATRGRALVLDRSTTCILCHSGPFGTQFQGDLAPSLAGAGNRWTASQLRLRLADAAHFNPDTIMPSYYRLDGLIRVGRNWTGKPILTADQIEDVVAYLATLKD